MIGVFIVIKCHKDLLRQIPMTGRQDPQDEARIDEVKARANRKANFFMIR